MSVSVSVIPAISSESTVLKQTLLNPGKDSTQYAGDTSIQSSEESPTDSHHTPPHTPTDSESDSFEHNRQQNNEQDDQQALRARQEFLARQIVGQCLSIVQRDQEVQESQQQSQTDNEPISGVADTPATTAPETLNDYFQQQQTVLGNLAAIISQLPTPEESREALLKAARKMSSTPSAKHQPSSGNSDIQPANECDRSLKRPASLGFSIDNILRPDFGPKPKNNALGFSAKRKRSASPCTIFNPSGSPNVSMSVISSAMISPISSGSPVSPGSLNSSMSFPQQQQQHQQMLLSPGGSSSNLTSPTPSLTSVTSNGSNTNKPATSGPTDGATPAQPVLWPAWVYCTRYSDRPSSGPRVRRPRTKKQPTAGATPTEPTAAAAPKPASTEEKRPRTAFTPDQLARLKQEFTENRYLTEKRRQDLASSLGLKESQIKIWFQNKRAKIKKTTGVRNPLALSLIAQGLYNHASTMNGNNEETNFEEDCGIDIGS